MLEIARGSKSRLRTSEETVSIKVRLPKSTAGQLKEVAERLEVPVASIIRQGISLVLEEVEKHK